MAEAVAECTQTNDDVPQWMKSLSKRLWTNKHQKEMDFNAEKLNKKKVMAFQTGGYVPTTGSEKRSLEKDAKKYQDREVKARKEWEKKVAQRCLAKGVLTKKSLSVSSGLRSVLTQEKRLCHVTCSENNLVITQCILLVVDYL